MGEKNTNKPEGEHTSTSGGELAQIIVDRLVEEKNKTLFDAILASPELEAASAGVGRIIVDYLRSVIIVRTIINESYTMRTQHAAQFEDTLCKEHRILSRVASWRTERVAQEMHKYDLQNRYNDWEKAIAAFESEGLVEASLLTRRDLAWRLEAEEEERARLASLRDPARVYQWGR